jgi:hypothetical protein
MSVQRLVSTLPLRVPVAQAKARRRLESALGTAELRSTAERREQCERSRNVEATKGLAKMSSHQQMNADEKGREGGLLLLKNALYRSQLQWGKFWNEAGICFRFRVLGGETHAAINELGSENSPHIAASRYRAGHGALGPISAMPEDLSTPLARWKIATTNFPVTARRRMSWRSCGSLRPRLPAPTACAAAPLDPSPPSQPPRSHSPAATSASSARIRRAFLSRIDPRD